MSVDFFCASCLVFIPHGPVRRHQAPTPDTPRAPWLCSRPDRGWPPAGRRPGSAGGCPDTGARQSETESVFIFSPQHSAQSKTTF